MLNQRTNSTRKMGGLGWRALVAAALLLPGGLRAISLAELRADPKLTPKRFASFFTDFEYAFHREVQRPDAFLITRSGDCDDYAILADLVLRPKGYETRLIAVRMPDLVAHVVCYVTQEKAYLDYNNRVYLLKLQHSGPTIRQIAAKVAKSFDSSWTTASEFTYTGGLKRLVATVVKTEPPDKDPVPGQPSPRIKIDF